MCLTLCLYLMFVGNLVDSFEQLYEGDDCTAGNYPGKCLNFYECDYAKNLVRQRRKPLTCDFKGKIPIVCCPLSSEPKQDQNLTVSKASQKVEESSSVAITFKKCKQYVNETENIDSFYSGDVATAMEFPHMASLGFGKNTDVKWLCGGSLISPDFVLTAAHCFSHPEYGDLAWILLGDLYISYNGKSKFGNRSVNQTFPHPKFRPPSHYHDIGLVKMGKPWNSFTQFIRPACLNFEQNIPNGPDVTSRLIGTGWGKIDFAGAPSTHLLKVEIDLVEAKTCIDKYKGVSRSKLANGILDEFQICAGDADGRDACQGDSGGPLQVKRKGWDKEYFTIVGVVSFGKACGVANSAGVYTRVSPYIPWIESIVWPSP